MMVLMRINPEETALSLLLCNAVTTRYGLKLSETDAKELAEAQSRALKSSGRVAFAGGVVNELALAFCDSPYIEQESWADTLSELTAAFYDFKNEAMDGIDDAEAVALMKQMFDGDWCEGSLDRLREELLPMAARRIREGLPPEPEMDDGDSEEEYDG